MKPSTIKHLKEVAPALLRRKVSKPTPVVEQRAIAILKILKNKKWHTTKQIAENLGIGRFYVGQILRTVKDDWGLTSSKSKGWIMNGEIEANQEEIL